MYHVVPYVSFGVIDHLMSIFPKSFVRLHRIRVRCRLRLNMFADFSLKMLLAAGRNDLYTRFAVSFKKSHDNGFTVRRVHHGLA